MLLNSILLNYVPDVGDFLLLIISVLLGYIAYISQRNMKRFDDFAKQNTVDHLNMEKRQIRSDEMLKSMHNFEINPVIKKAADNERHIVEIRGTLRNHEGRIKSVEKRG